MSDGGERPYQLGDGDRQAAADAEAFIAALRAGRPAEISNGEREADKAEIAKLRADLTLTQRAVVKHGERIHDLKMELTAVRNAVVELPKQRLPAARRSAPVRRRDGLDAALERELYE